MIDVVCKEMMLTLHWRRLYYTKFTELCFWCSELFKLSWIRIFPNTKISTVVTKTKQQAGMKRKKEHWQEQRNNKMAQTWTILLITLYRLLNSWIIVWHFPCLLYLLRWLRFRHTDTCSCGAEYTPLLWIPCLYRLHYQ